MRQVDKDFHPVAHMVSGWLKRRTPVAISGTKIAQARAESSFLGERSGQAQVLAAFGTYQRVQRYTHSDWIPMLDDYERVEVHDRDHRRVRRVV